LGNKQPEPKPWLSHIPSAVPEAELRKLPEFQASKLKIVGDAKDADLAVDITLPLITWTWNYTVTHRASNTALFSSKRKGLPDESVSPNVAKDIVGRLQALRGQ